MAHGISFQAQQAQPDRHDRYAPRLPDRLGVRTCAAWCDNLVATWDDAVTEAGEATSKVWGLYLAGSRLGFERDQVQLHQVLGVKPRSDGRADFPLRPAWGA